MNDFEIEMDGNLEVENKDLESIFVRISFLVKILYIPEV